MDSFEWNKVLAGILATGLFVVALRIGTEMVFEHEPLENAAYVIEVPEEAPAGGTAVAAAEPHPDFGTVIPAADTANGAKVAEKCLLCHVWTKGGANKIGPVLYDIVERPRAQVPGFAYSAAMTNKGGNWTYGDLYDYLRQPARFMPGNKMAFAGLPRSQDRIDVIAFLRMQSDSPAALPPPMPAAEPVPPAGSEAAPAEGAAAPAVTPTP